MRLFKFVFGKILGGLFAIAAIVLVVGLWKLQMLPMKVVILVGVLLALATALVIALTWSERRDVLTKVAIIVALVGISITAMALTIVLWQGQIIPTKLIVLVGILLALIMAVVILLSLSSRDNVRFVFGIVLAAIGIAVMCTGSFYVWKAVSTLNDLSAGDTEIVQMGVYMRSDDTRELNNETVGSLQFGILASMDRQATDKVIEKLNKELKTEISCKEYESESTATLVDALLKDEVDAIILNQALLQPLEGSSGYGEKLAKIREVFVHSVEIKTDDDDNNPGGESAMPNYTSLKDSFAVYISGIDTRGEPSVKSRSDVNIVAVVNPETKQILLVSTPRDYYVPISSPKKGLDGKRDKLTHAGLGGPNASRETLSNLYNINIPYYFKVNFSGFEEIVDAMDGITVHSDYNFKSVTKEETYYYQKGENAMDGKKALAFCRNRYAFADGDNQRGKNQMAVIKAVIDKAMSPKLLTNYTKIMDAVAGSMEMTVPRDIIGNLVSRQLAEGGSWNVVSYSVTGTGGYEKSPAAYGESLYVMYPNQASVERAKQLIADVIDGKTVTP